jgi:DNA-binding NarL/FixJ family response regulator
MTIRLAIIDGPPLTRYGLRELIPQHPDIEIVAEGESAADAQKDHRDIAARCRDRGGHPA